MRKEYLMPGVNEAIIKLRYGKMTLTASFKGGDKLNKVPAKFATNNELYQLIIENDNHFNSSIFFNGPANKVKIIKADTTALPAVTGEVNKDTIVVDSVKDINDAVDYLFTEHSVPKIALRTPEMVMNKAEKMNIKFPNLQL